MNYSAILDLTNFSGEIWRSIGTIKGIDYKNDYKVSNLGRVKSIERTVLYKNGKVIHLKEKILRPFINNSGYYVVDLYKNNKKKHFLIHYIVATVFIPNNDESKIIINHKDEDKLNNCVENLEWCTYEYNNTYGTTNKRTSKTLKEKYTSGELVPPERPKRQVVQLDINNNYIKTWESISSTKSGGFCKTSVIDCCNGVKKTHHGYKWMYLSDYITYWSSC